MPFHSLHPLTDYLLFKPWRRMIVLCIKQLSRNETAVDITLLLKYEVGYYRQEVRRRKQEEGIVCMTAYK